MKSLYLPELNATIRYYDIAGDGEEVYVWLPGLSTSCSSLMHVATHPKIVGRRSILVDYLGTGYSDKPFDFDHTMHSHSECIAAILRHESISRCTIIGHSMGGTVALHLILNHPHLVTRLIMSEGNIEPGGGTGARAIASFSEDSFVRDEFPKMMDAFHKGSAAGIPNDQFHSGYYSIADPRGIHRQSVSLVNLDPSIKAKWFNMNIPRTFIIGEFTDPRKTGKRLPDTPYPDELSPHGINVFVVPRSGHFFMIDNLDGYADAIDRGLKVSASVESGAISKELAAHPIGIRFWTSIWKANKELPYKIRVKFHKYGGHRAGPLGIVAPIVIGVVTFKIGTMLYHVLRHPP